MNFPWLKTTKVCFFHTGQRELFPWLEALLPSSETPNNEAVTFWKARGAEPEGLKVLKSLSAIQWLNLVIHILPLSARWPKLVMWPPSTPRGQEEQPSSVPGGSQPEICRESDYPSLPRPETNKLPFLSKSEIQTSCWSGIS